MWTILSLSPAIAFRTLSIPMEKSTHSPSSSLSVCAVLAIPRHFLSFATLFLIPSVPLALTLPISSSRSCSALSFAVCIYVVSIRVFFCFYVHLHHNRHNKTAIVYTDWALAKYHVHNFLPVQFAVFCGLFSRFVRPCLVFAAYRI